MSSVGDTGDLRSNLADIEEDRCRLGRAEVEVHSAQARVMLMLVGDHDADFAQEMQVEMVEEFAKGVVVEVFEKVHGQRKGDLGELVSMVDTGSTALANEP